MSTDNELLLEAERDAIIALRHALHREPELSNAEWKTQKRIAAALAAFGMSDARAFHGTGLYIDIDGAMASDAPVAVAVRGDIDALPIVENRPDLDYRSTVEGAMHACGHDMHASVALGTAIALHRMRADFAGRVRIFFHPAEEAEPLGGRSVLEHNLLDGFDCAVGLHIKPALAEGTFTALAGPITKSSDQFRVVFHGEMAHGASPSRGVDAILMAAAFANEVQKIPAREMHPDEGTVITIGTIHGGEATNIICPMVTLEGTVRTRVPASRSVLHRRLREIAEGCALMHRGRAECSFILGEPPVVNDPGLVARFRALVEEIHGPEAFVAAGPSDGSDDFGFYAERVPAIYFWFGGGNPAAGNVTDVHTPTFGASDALLATTTTLMVRYCLDLLRFGLP